MIYRKKYIDEFHRILNNQENRYIAVIWPTGVGKSTFLSECATYDVFWKKGSYEYFTLKGDAGLPEIKAIAKNTKLIIIDNETNVPLSEIRSFIEWLSSEIRVILSCEEDIFDEDITPFILPGLSLREYLEHETGDISIGSLLSGNLDITVLNTLRDIYTENGSSPYSLLAWGTTLGEFDKKRAIMNQELYEKEYSDFDSYMRTIAMNIGNLFKADQIAKLLGISRRKVNKYTEILIKYRIVEALGPWAQNLQTDTSRHVKLYFTELGFLKALLGNIHNEWTLKQGTIENLIFLELKRKLSETHTLYFYRKKSGAQITFMAEDNTTGMLTPIEVTTRSTATISQVFKVFDIEYNDRVERYMLFNDSKIEMTILNEKQFMILPHVAI